MTRLCRSFLSFLIIALYLSQSSAVAMNAPDYLTAEEQAWLKEHPVVRLGVGVAFPPFQWVEKEGDNNRFKGMVADYVELLENRLGIDMRVEYGLTFGEALEKGRAREIDLFPCLSKTPERSEFLMFTEPYLSYPLVIITQRNAPVITGIYDLANKRVALVKSLMPYSTLKNQYPKLIFSPVETNTVGENLDRVSLGTADACIINLAVASYLIHQKGLTNLKVSAPLKWDEMSYSMGIRSDWPEFHSIINKTLKRMSYKEKDPISQKWIQVDYPSGVETEKLLRWGTGIGLAVLVVFGFVFSWNRRLQQEIQERKRAEEATRESENRYRALFESANDAIYILDGDRYVEANPKGLELFGVARHELIGKTPFDYSPEDQAGFKSREIGEEILKRVLAGIPSSFEWVHQRKDGSLFYSSVSLSRITIHGSYHILAIGRDISEQKTMLKEKQELEEQLRQARKMEAIGTLSGGIAHDFNNILSIVLGNADLALDSIPDDHPVRLFLNEIRTAGLRAKDVVSQLLSFSRKSERSKRPTDIGACVSECVKLLRATLPASVGIRTILPNDPVTIMADATQIQQVLINLCTNATHAMESEGGVLKVDVATLFREVGSDDNPYAVSSRQFVQITVTDTGHGISPDIKDRIFDPYFTTKDVGKGSGMGLAVVHGIVKDHEGLVSIHSVPGEGCSVKVLFPVIEGVAEEPPSLQPTLPGGSETILLVDDEASLMAMSSQILTKLGYHVISQSDPENALACFRLEPERFDLVITDMAMPVMSGDQLIQKLRDIRPDIPAILTTGFSEKIDRDKAEILGIQCYLEKPVRRDLLAASVRDVLDGADR